MIPIPPVAVIAGAATCIAVFRPDVAVENFVTLNIAGYANARHPLTVDVPVCTASAIAAPHALSTDATKLHRSNRFEKRISPTAERRINVAVEELEEILNVHPRNILDLNSWFVVT